jgi:toxin ParE1/3/4
MVYPIIISVAAVLDIDQAVEYYNSKSFGLGFVFAETLDKIFKSIALLPTSTAIRFDNVRVKPIDTFPYNIHFILDDRNRIIILRVFNTHQNPFW